MRAGDPGVRSGYAHSYRWRTRADRTAPGAAARRARGRGRRAHPRAPAGGDLLGPRAPSPSSATWSRRRSRRSRRHLEGADAAVFAAGAGPGSGAERKDTVDRGAAVLFADAAETRGRTALPRRLLHGRGRRESGTPEGTDPVFAAYLRAKGAADADVRSRAALDWTVLRPGRLTDGTGTGRVRLAERDRPRPMSPATTWPRCWSRCWTRRGRRASRSNWWAAGRRSRRRSRPSAGEGARERVSARVIRGSVLAVLATPAALAAALRPRRGPGRRSRRLPGPPRLRSQRVSRTSGRRRPHRLPVRPGTRGRCRSRRSPVHRAPCRPAPRRPSAAPPPDAHASASRASRGRPSNATPRSAGPPSRARLPGRRALRGGGLQP